MLPNYGVKLTGASSSTPALSTRPSCFRPATPLGPGQPGRPRPLLRRLLQGRWGRKSSTCHVSFLDSTPNSIIDDLWAWRADHGTTPTSTGWTVNTGDTGLVVSANDVTAYGLAVEHFQKYEVVWSGQGGTVEFFQNELPYDVPNQADWMATPTQDGYPAFLVSPHVTTFSSYGMGSYVMFLQTSAQLINQEPFEVPTTSGVHLTNTFTVMILPSNGGDNSVVDDKGGPNINSPSNPSKSGAIVDLPSYP